MKSGMIIYFIAFLVFISCTDPERENKNNYFPLREGNVWRFRDTEKDLYSDEVLSIETTYQRIIGDSLHSINNYTNYYYILFDTADSSKILLRKDDDYLWAVIDRIDMDILFKVSKLELFIFDFWSSFPDISPFGTVDVYGKCLAESTLAIGDNVFEDCMCIELRREVSSSVAVDDTLWMWFAPEIGPVRYESEDIVSGTRSIRELTNYTLVD